MAVVCSRKRAIAQSNSNLVGKTTDPYNLIVGMTGFISLLLFFLFITKSGELKPGEDAIEQWHYS
jgi:hypothetical protein